MGPVVDVCAPLLVLAVSGCCAYLRSINQKLVEMGQRDFNQDLHLIDHEQRLAALEPRRI